MSETNEEKMRQALDAFSKIGERTLLAPPAMKNPAEAKAYMMGSSAAFKQIASAAQFALESLSAKES